MSNKIHTYKTIKTLTTRLRDDFVSGNNDFLLLYAYNGTGKTRLSTAFKDTAKNKGAADTLYFNAFTEDLFTWENDFENDNERYLKINSESKFFDGFKELALEQKISSYLGRYVRFDFDIDYEKWKISFSKDAPNPKYRKNSNKPKYIKQENIKISRGEENLFIWCIFLAIAELAIEGDGAYKWVKHLYIDDPVSSLDDNNAIAVASDLAGLLKNEDNKLKTVISSHHSLFFNVICNELKKLKHRKYFLHKIDDDKGYTLRTTDETPFFHHVAMLDELQKVENSNKIYTYHFNILRGVLEKTAVFFGFKDFSDCLGDENTDKDLHARALNLLSHGKYSIYQPVEMNEDNKKLFKEILKVFLDNYQFELPQLH